MTSRQDWPVRRYRLGEEPGDDLSRTTSAEERLSMTAQLSEEAWSLSGRPGPAYRRAETPITRRTLRSQS